MESSGDEYSLADKTIVNNEVLGNVLRGLLYNIKEEDIFSTVDNCFSSDEVYEARKVLVKLFFGLFDQEEPNGRYIGPKEREIKKDENLTEIILKMQEVVRMDHDVEFCIPWNYSYVVVSDEEKRFQQMVRQKDLEIDMKFQNLEKTIEMKNREVISAVKSIIDNVGGAEREGDIYIHASGDSADAAGLKGRNHNQGGSKNNEICLQELRGAASTWQTSPTRADTSMFRFSMAWSSLSCLYSLLNLSLTFSAFFLSAFNYFLAILSSKLHIRTVLEAKLDLTTNESQNTQMNHFSRYLTKTLSESRRCIYCFCD